MLRVTSIKIGDPEDINTGFDREPLAGRSFSSKAEMLPMAQRRRSERRKRNQDDRNMELITKDEDDTSIAIDV